MKSKHYEIRTSYKNTPNNFETWENSTDLKTLAEAREIVKDIEQYLKWSGEFRIYRILNTQEIETEELIESHQLRIDEDESTQDEDDFYRYNGN